MRKLSAEAKQAIIDKVLARDGRTVVEIAKLHNISYSTLQKWIRKVRNGDIIDPVKSVKDNQALSLSERFTHLMATASLDETAVGIYCREHGLYAIQLTQWKEAFMTQKPDLKKQDNLALTWQRNQVHVLCPLESRLEVLTALADFGFYEGELHRLESDVEAQEPQAEKDVGFAHRIHHRNKEHWQRFGETIERFTRDDSS